VEACRRVHRSTPLGERLATRLEGALVAASGVVSLGYTSSFMPRDRAKTFADRLPPVVPKEESDISQLSDEMVDILYPGRRKRPFRIGLLFDDFGGPNYPRALELAKRAPVYRESHEGRLLRHYAAFDSTGVNVLRELFEIVGPVTGTEVLVDDKKIPYARELWLPMFWLFEKEEA
jgi:hypothetical protein